MVAVETLVVTGICLFYLHNAICECLYVQRPRPTPIPNPREIRWRMIDYPILLVPPTTVPMAAPYAPMHLALLDTMAPLDPTVPQEKATETCSICLDELVQPRKTTCGHRFCSECIREWLRRKQVCPLCNTSLP